VQTVVGQPLMPHLYHSYLLVFSVSAGVPNGEFPEILIAKCRCWFGADLTVDDLTWGRFDWKSIIICIMLEQTTEMCKWPTTRTKQWYTLMVATYMKYDVWLLLNTILCYYGYQILIDLQMDHRDLLMTTKFVYIYYRVSHWQFSINEQPTQN
jgi:hypothetical protein